jgi:hypothetical protein
LADGRGERRRSPPRDGNTNTACEYREQRAGAIASELSHRVESNQRASMRTNKTTLLHALFE